MKKNQYKLATFSLTLLLAFTLLMSSTPVAMAADGAAGAIEDNIGNAIDGERVYVHLFSLDVSADYKLNHTGDATGESFTTGASQTEIYVPITLAKSATTEVYVIWLYPQSTGAALDQITIFVSDASDLTQEDLFMDLAIPIMIMAIFAGIALGFVGGKKRG